MSTNVTDKTLVAGGLSIMGLITARGGSKGIPRKNLIPIGGRPLISYTIEAALESNGPALVHLVTDPRDITPFGPWDP